MCKGKALQKGSFEQPAQGNIWGMFEKGVCHNMSVAKCGGQK